VVGSLASKKQLGIASHRSMNQDRTLGSGESPSRAIKSGNCALSPNKSLQRSARGIKCSAAGGRASCSMNPRRARVLTSQPAAAELSR
jgi:hypothetical protein